MQPILCRVFTGFLLVTFCFTGGKGYEYFRVRIPNGYNVTNPCNTSAIWRGVGHESESGGGDRNPFGLDFAANGFVYNSTLCRKDSDGDGKTNGEELGDPDCIWTEGALPSRTTGITHPGICEALNSSQCQGKNDWLTCEAFSCSGANGSDIMRLNLKFPKTAVPAEETTYICLGFQLPSDKKYHLVGTSPIIDNIKFLHHIVLYGCTAPSSAAFMENPHQCQMAEPGCLNPIVVWGAGLGGYCYPDDIGFAIGDGSFKYVLLQLHWNNPTFISGELDGSGMTLYYTDKLRPNEASITMVGQMSLTIPPGQQMVEEVGYCSAKCTDTLGDKKLKILTAFLHMHLLGRSGEVVLTHDGVEQTIISEPNYKYNYQKIVEFHPYLDFDAGDELKLTCRFNSEGRINETNWGEGTQDEMCFVVLIVIPDVKGFTVCSQYKSSDVCTLSDNVTYAGCDIQGLYQSLGYIGFSCNMDCSPQCMQSIQSMKATKCFDIEIGGYIRQFWPANDARVLSVFQIADYCTAKTMALTNTVGPGPTGSLGQSIPDGSSMDSVGQSSPSVSTSSSGMMGPGMSTGCSESGSGSGNCRHFYAAVIISSLFASLFLLAI